MFGEFSLISLAYVAQSFKASEDEKSELKKTNQENLMKMFSWTKQTVKMAL